MKRVLLLALIVGSSAAVHAVVAQNEAEAVRAAITAANRAFSEAYVRGDAPAVARMYTPDGVLMPPGRVLLGHAAIERHFTSSPTRKLIAHKLETEDLRTYGNVAVEIGRWTSTASTNGQPPVTNSERYLLVWHKQADGSWKISHDVWHLPRPPA